MFVCTFYSFKGGVGRSMAVMNVAATLVRGGRRVLVVDFDLEAPGLTTFKACAPARGKGGIVEYVSEYRSTGQAPDAGKYISECELEVVEPDGSRRQLTGLSVMPAGDSEGVNYSQLFAGLDWRALYETENGFLLFEDLRAQWEDMGFDYVLLDSRTGHTDISGICTRQLPDAVAMVFFPNEQNLNGLLQIAADVRAEPSADQPIDLMFVASRVPNLDDENEILSGLLTRFQTELGYSDRKFSTVHHYDSLALLDQRIFVLERPKTSLAKEYAALSSKITSMNAEDARGAVRFLRDISGNTDGLPNDVTSVSAPLADREASHVFRIQQHHAQDFVVMLMVASFYYNKSMLSDAREAIEAASAHIGQTRTVGYDESKVVASIYGLKMRICRELEEFQASVSAALSLLDQPNVASAGVRDALNTLAFHAPEKLPHPNIVVDLLDLDNNQLLKYFLSLPRSPVMTVYSAQALRWAIEKNGVGDLPDRDRLAVSLRLIAGGEMKAAADLLLEPRDEIDFFSIAFGFNLAIANWGLAGEPDKKQFCMVYDMAMQLNPQREEYEANFFQCLALAAGVAGKLEEAERLIDDTQMMAGDGMVTPFSCWTFQNETVAEFTYHCELIRDFLFGGGHPPQVIVRDDEEGETAISIAEE